MVAAVANWVTARGNKTVGAVVRSVAGLHPDAELPRYAGQRFDRMTVEVPAVNHDAPAFGRKAVLYATCFVDYFSPELGVATRAVLARNGVETEIVYPGCCGMPLLEQGRLAEVAANARKVAGEMKS
jgi:glycerol-3-phosphate dehydrogenase subunit C